MNKEETIKYLSTDPVAPGETVLDVLEARGMSQIELAKRLDRPAKTVNGIIKGKVALTPETALQLEHVFGIPANFWNNLESQYQETKLRIESQKKYKKFISQSKIYPYHEMAKYGWLDDVNNAIKRVENLLKYFGVTHFDNIIEEAGLKSAFRISDKHKYSMPAVVSWLRKGSIDGEQIKTDSFEEEKVKELLPKLREMTLISEPNELMAKLQEELSKCGLAFVVTRNLKNAPISGATRWVSSDKAIIQMSIRWNWADIFWFSLFHELGHIMLDSKKDFNVDLVNNKVNNSKESEADIFARDSLIPLDKFQELKKRISDNNFSSIYELITSFARQVGIHPGIVIGRLQYEKIIPNNMNRLRVRFNWV